MCMESDSIVLIGGGGHCKAVIDVIEATGKFQIAGIVDTKDKVGQTTNGYKIFATDDALPQLIKTYKHFVITVGQIKNNKVRVRIFDQLKSLGATLPTIISPLAYVSPRAQVAEGTVILHKALINNAATVGVNCIINTGAIVEHDAIVGNHCHISTNVTLNGTCAVADHSFVGSSTVVSHGVKIAEYNVIGAGSVVLNNTLPHHTLVGNPAKTIK